ncbi:MAG: laccase domain-containing protein [Desulfovibrionaceae bacterium]|nr:laccase domain-containing protein [Desulfovibrionaceae bacterium]
MSLAIHFNFPGLPNVHCLFPLRDLSQISPNNPYSGGNLAYEIGDDKDNVSQNRQDIIQKYASLGLKRILDIKQVHGQTIIFDPEKLDLSTISGDGLASCAKNCGLLIKTADCQPVLLCDEKGQYILALHIGWRGSRANFIGQGIAEFCQKYNLKPANLLAVRGPSLGPSVAEFKNYQTEWLDAHIKEFFDLTTLTMDLWSMTRRQLEDAGLKPKNIYGLDLCTYSNLTCFSYRRNKICGRQGGLIWIN